MNKLLDIADSYRRALEIELGFVRGEFKEIAIKRYAICKQCEKNVNGKCKAMNCGCPLKAKVASTQTQCPLNKWSF